MKNTKQRHQGQKGVHLVVILLGAFLLNMGGRFLANQFQLPFWLDTVGTCVAASYLTLPWVLLVAVAPVAMSGITNPVVLVYSVVAALIAVALRFCVRKGYLENLTSAMMASFGVGVLSIAVSLPLDLHFNEGYTLNIWGDALHDMLQFYGYPPAVCALAGEAIVNMIDKQLCVFLGFVVVKLLHRWSGRRQEKQRELPRFGPLLLAVLVSFSVLLPGLTVPAQAAGEETSSLSDYVKTIYDNTNGLPSTGVNMIEQTPDGAIWVGGYAGLSRCNGTDFEYVTEGSLANVTAMMVDRDGRLWVGTNDRGVAVLDHEEFHFIAREDGLSENSVRVVFQTEAGEIYVGTTDQLCRILPDGTAETMDWGITRARSIAENDYGVLAFVDFSGNLILVQDGQVILRQQLEIPGERYTCVLAHGQDFWVGTSDHLIQRLRLTRSHMMIKETVDLGELEDVVRLEWDTRNNLWVCAYTGSGYVDEERNVTILRYPGFDNAVEDVIEDYEGNYWLASSRYGVMKLSLSPFSDIYSYMGLEKKVINAVTVFQEHLYCATDSGIDVLDYDGNRLSNALTEQVGTQRVRCVGLDSQNRIWACTYGGGLISWNGVDEPQVYTKENSGAAGNYFRCLLELPDGTMAAGGSEGITFIKDGQVTGILNEENGLETTQILSMVLNNQGDIYAGSDGSGIYVIRDGQVVDTLNEEEGLSSRIILRLVPYASGCFVVTSNSLNYLERGQARRLEKFPYFNNFDIVLNQGKAWVLASCGIFVTTPEALLSTGPEKLTYKLYDYSNGLQGSITANSWTYVDQNSNLYFCSNVGVEKINMSQQQGYTGPYRTTVSGFRADGVPVKCVNGVYHLGTEVEQVEISAAVFNYTLEDLKVRFFVEGLEKNPEVIRQSALAPITYRSIPHGEYTLRLQLLNDREDVLQAQSLRIVKEAQMWENRYFQVYLIVVFTWVIIFTTWVFITLRQTSRKKQQLEEMSRQLEEKVREQTSEIREQAQRIAAMQQNVIEGMASLIESRDGSTGEHVRNTGTYVRMIAQEMFRRGMYPDEIDQRYVDTVGEVAPLHDVGKIKISDTVLNKPGRFTDEEYAIMKTHASLGGGVVKDILGENADPYVLEMAQNISTYHHERWDGHGYPSGKAGTEIPLCARIMAVADVFDALVSKRVYKDAMPVDEVFEEMKRCAGTQFQKEIVDVFLEMRPQIEAYLNRKKHS